MTNARAIVTIATEHYKLIFVTDTTTYFIVRLVRCLMAEMYETLEVHRISSFPPVSHVFFQFHLDTSA